MSTSSYYNTKNKVQTRTSRIHRDINRSSAYILESSSSPVRFSRIRSSSLTRDAPSSSRYVDPSNKGYRFKDIETTVSSNGGRSSRSSFRETSAMRTTSGTRSIDSTNMSSNYRFTMNNNNNHNKRETTMSVDYNPHSETARYNREQEMKEIHDQFMRNWKDTNDKYSGDENARKSKAYHKIMGTAVSALEDRDYKRSALGEIFKDINKYSTNTVAALSSLDGTEIRKNKNYNWRKEIEKYESTGQLEKDARMRNIEKRNKVRQRESNNETISSSSSRKRENIESINGTSRYSSSRNTSSSSKSGLGGGGIQANESKKTDMTTKPPKATKREPDANAINYNEKKITSSSSVIKPANINDNNNNNNTDKRPLFKPSKTSKEENGEELSSSSSASKSQIKIPEESSSNEVKTPSKVRKLKKKADSTIPQENGESIEKPSDMNQTNGETPAEIGQSENDSNEQEKEEDLDGTLKMKKEFDARMAEMDAEFSSGRSKLAKIRERIRKAKQGIMEVGEMIEKC